MTVEQPGETPAGPMGASDEAMQRYTPWEYVYHGSFFFVYGCVKYLPTPIGDLLRWGVLKCFFKRLGTKRIKDGVTVWFPQNISVGRRVSINEWVFLDGYGGIEIGDNVRIAHGCSIVSEDHAFDRLDVPIYRQRKIPGKITIGEDVWLGAGVRVMRGVTIGKGCVVGAGSVVTKDLPPYSVAVGVPAKPIRRRDGAALSA